MDSTFCNILLPVCLSNLALPTVAELVSREPVLKKGSTTGSSSSGNNVTAKPDVAGELFTERSSSAERTPSAEPKAKKMKISRSKLDYHMVIYFKFII
ncbi:unnamed protein product [Brugia timori]|uniref:Secreted protein n=1 Tax=Brugia timori TaxID=42155 RepID=A0A0R3QWZ4_9BILA|nr:unnamed protein product [Brugia timori]